jgi:2-phosphosulfolactate phosphatase
MTIYGQDGHAVRLEWGPDGVRELGVACAVLIIVDVLVFTTSVDVALGRGGRVLPLPWRDERADRAALAAGAILTRSGLRRSGVGFDAERTSERWTLRPSSLVNLPEGTFLAMGSPNGGTLCAAAASTGATVLAGCLRNAGAVAKAARELAEDRPIGVIPGGERWHHTADRGLRPSVEDLLGAGALVHAMDAAGCSPEAELAALTYAAVADRVPEVLAGSVSGRELAHAGVPVDVTLAGDVGASDVVPILTDGVFQPWTG